ncbi:O-antigen ligase family protein [Winogradskyella aquimaris]|uniref:O-antigen ligase family protein n=1 Tax=Winogradskyella aquimaris TaxID=864074 RepID=A0ABU5ELY0_9FLAO|nr:O-antigen ligase family protein [Winogradskyella aquimaris]MDY2587077.1 O-antigen ligase family protein [Winogradskyella aquimaris]
MIIVPLLIIVVIFIVRFQKGMFAALLIIVATKSLLDAFWEYRIGPLSFISFQGLVIPFLFMKIYSNRKVLPKAISINASLIIISYSIGLIFALPVEPLATFELIIININIFLGFFLIPMLVITPKRLKQFLLALIFGGIFPILVSVYQFITGDIFHVRETVNLSRYVGFYHDAFPVRFYGLMTLFSVIVYFKYFKPKNNIISLCLAGVAIGAIFSIYLVFSKAGIGILVCWAVLLIFSKRGHKNFLFLALGLLVIIFLFGSDFFSNIEQLFSKEIDYQEGVNKDARYTLAGRGYIWQKLWALFQERTLFFQWFGNGFNSPAHNEFLRVLLLSGFVGLIFFVLFLFNIVKTIFKFCKRDEAIFSLMLLTVFIFDCMGLIPGVFYYYNIIIWGFISFFILNKKII